MFGDQMPFGFRTFHPSDLLIPIRIPSVDTDCIKKSRLHQQKRKNIHLSGLICKHSVQYLTSPWMDLMTTGMSLAMMSCSKEAFGSRDASMESNSSDVSLKLRGTLPGGNL